jgi:PAS domain S-box-containing protein
MLSLIFAVIFILIAAGVGGYFWLRRRNTTVGSRKVNQLRGALLSKELQAEILIDSITDGIIVTDTANRITLFNRAAAAMTEWEIEDAMGIDAVSVLPLLADEKTSTMVETANHPFSKVLLSHTALNETFQLVSRANKRLFISLAISPVVTPKDNQFMGTVAVFRDVSRAKGEEQARADFVSTASHEMRTPVAAIEGYLALAMNDKVSKIDAKARDYLEKAHSSTQHLGKLFQDLLTSAKAEDGRLTSHPVVVDMGAFVEMLADDLRFGAEKKGLLMEFVTNSAPAGAEGIVDARGKVIQPLYFVQVDPDRIREVITNLFDNAVKYTPEGKVSLGITGNNDVVQIRVNDTGPGIPPGDVPHLFQKFYRVDNSATRSIGGTGLGLFICKKIVELYNGTIWAESEVGKGSTFYINIPRLSTQRAHELQEIEKAHPLA